MKLYFASPTNSDFYTLKLFGVKKYLFSYHYLKKMQKRDYRKYLKADDVFLDSGAFSAKSLGVEINLSEYIDFIKENKIENYASLDVIGDGDKTLENTKKMMKAGLKPIHTFHKGSELRHLENSLELDLDYIALGGMVGSANSKKDLMDWLDRVFDIIMRNKPTLKVHGFGCTSYDIMSKYPWYSVDSTTWNVARKFGEGFDTQGNRQSKYKIIKSFSGEKYFEFFDEGDLLLISTVYTMLKWEQIIGEKNKNNDFKYITSQTVMDF